jgi:flagellar biosynthetic protein FlhB
MAEQDSGERTEEPTGKRIEDARKQGDVAISRDLVSIATLGAAMLALFSFPVAILATSLLEQAGSSWSGAIALPESAEDFRSILLRHGLATATAFLPFALVLFGVGTSVGFVQTGPLFSPEAFGWKASRLNPIQGFGRLFSRDRLLDLAKAPLKVGIVCYALYLAFESALPALTGLFDSPAAAWLALTRELAMEFSASAFAGLLLLGLVDLAWSRWRYREKLKMTPREVRDELREREANPQVRGKRRAMQRELSRLRMLADVARADVVVANPTHYSVALQYDRAAMAAPKVVARGQGEFALKIRREARLHGVPIVENPPLARVLYAAGRVGREVPQHLFQAVAEVLAFVYRVDRRRGEKWSVGR